MEENKSKAMSLPCVHDINHITWTVAEFRHLHPDSYFNIVVGAHNSVLVAPRCRKCKEYFTLPEFELAGLKGLQELEEQLVSAQRIACNLKMGKPEGKISAALRWISGEHVKGLRLVEESKDTICKHAKMTLRISENAFANVMVDVLLDAKEEQCGAMFDSTVGVRLGMILGIGYLLLYCTDKESKYKDLYKWYDSLNQRSY